MIFKRKYSISIVPLTLKGQGLQFRISGITVFFLIFCIVSIFLFAIMSFYGFVKMSSQRPNKNPKDITQLQQEYNQLKTEYDNYKKVTEEHITLFQTSLCDIYKILGVEEKNLTDSSSEGRGGPLSFENPESTIITNQLKNVTSLELEKLMSISSQTFQMRQIFNSNESLANSLPTKLPIKDNDSYTITDRFGWRIHPVFGKRDFHSGLDIASKYRTKIIAPADGIVVWIGYQGALGNTIEIDHSNSLLMTENGELLTRSIKTRYSHLTKILVKRGQVVKRGDIIGLMGSSGLSTAPHLHYEVVVAGKCVDPMDFILDVK